MTTQMLKRLRIFTLFALLFAFGSVTILQGTALAVVEDIDENRIKEISPLLSEKPAGFGRPITERNAWENLAKKDRGARG